MKKFLVSITTIALTSLGLFGAVLPAQAHSDEVSSTPAAGSTVEAGAIPVELQFAEPLMVMDDATVGHEIVITDENGTEVSMSACATASAETLTATAMIDKAGEYNAYWRTVSEDGHPVEGNFKFTVTNTTGYVVDASKTIICEANAGVHEHEAEGEHQEATNAMVYIVIGIIAVAVGITVMFISLGRRRK